MIDVFYKIKALHESGVQVHLHCFEYGRRHPDELKKICKSVHYYKRSTGIHNIFKQQPYIVATRTSEALLRNLLKDNHPILFEGLHTTFYIDHPALISRDKIVRTHNIEHEYYSSLYEVEDNQFSKQYFRIESKKLKKYESVLNAANAITAISLTDYKYFSQKYQNVSYVPAFHPFNKVDIKEGLGDFILYHGNLSVGENIKAALFLINEVFNHLNISCVLAGKNPDKELVKAVSGIKNIRIIKNPSKSEMDALISNAHINVLPTFQETGIKLKLLASLFSGRFCIVNNQMVRNTGLEKYCSIKNKPQTMIQEIKRLYKLPFSKKLILERNCSLLKEFSNIENSKKIIELIGKKL